ncbi:MAG: YciI family protein [Knoellia sp.]
MQFLMLVCQDRDDSTQPPTQADRDGAPDVEQWWQGVNDAGKYVMGERLRPVAESRSVRMRDGKLLVTQGPFTETSELIAGFDVLQCDSMEEAVQIASGHSMAHGGVIEVRQMWPFEG